MPRQPRFEAPGTFHVGARGNRRQPLYLADADASRFRSGLADVVRACRWTCFAYCLMPNHYHLALETSEPNLGAGMRELNGRYAQWFNRRYGFGGHLFQGRFSSTRIETDSHLLEVARYVVLNPVRAGLCFRPEDWPWSSYRATVGLEDAPPFLAQEPLLSQFSTRLVDARSLFAAFVREAPTRVAA